IALLLTWRFGQGRRCGSSRVPSRSFYAWRGAPVMHIADLPRVKKLSDELGLWREVEQRCQDGIFKSGQLMVTDAAHGAQGIPQANGAGSMQNGQTIVPLEARHIRPIAASHIQRIVGELRELRVDV